MQKSNSNRALSVQGISGTYVNLLGINIEETHKSGVLGFGIHRTDLTHNNEPVWWLDLGHLNRLTYPRYTRID
jgi:hypothetical protein